MKTNFLIKLSITAILFTQITFCSSSDSSSRTSPDATLSPSPTALSPEVSATLWKELQAIKAEAHACNTQLDGIESKLHALSQSEKTFKSTLQRAAKHQSAAESIFIRNEISLDAPKGDGR